MLVSPSSPEPSREPCAGPDPAEILKQVDRISASSTFARSERLRRFLRFVVEQRIAGCADNLKEFVIGMAVFDRDQSYDPRLDPIVRVEASRLRTKLRDFYQNEGRDDAVRIEFEKGSYAPVITFAPKAPVVVELPKPEASAEPDRPASRGIPMHWFAAAVGAFISVLAWAVIAQAALWSERSINAQKQQMVRPFLPLWGKFLGGAENSIVFGSPVFFMSPATDYFHRYVHLNESSNLQRNPVFTDMQKRFGPLVGPRYDYVEAGDAMVLQRLTAFLGRLGTTVKAIPSHEATWDGIKEGNILFIGSNRMHPLIARLPDALHFTFDDDYNVVNHAPAHGEPKRWDAVIHSKIYAIVSRLPGLSGEHDILVLTSHSSPGTMAAAEYLTRADTVEPLSRRLNLRPEGNEHFQALLRVYVDGGRPVKTEYVTHHFLPDQPSKP